MVMDGVNAAMVDNMGEEEWKKTARSFARNVRTLCDMMYALDCGVDVEDYPRAMYESTRKRRTIAGGSESEGRKTTTTSAQGGAEKKRGRTTGRPRYKP